MSTNNFNSIEVLTEEKISRYVLSLLDKPKRLLDLREALKKKGILVSYPRLKKIVEQLIEEDLVTCFKFGKSVMYIKKEKLLTN